MLNNEIKKLRRAERNQGHTAQRRVFSAGRSCQVCRVLQDMNGEGGDNGDEEGNSARTKSALERAIESTTQSLITFKHLSPQDYEHEAH
jgi:hypothetical protein